MDSIEIFPHETFVKIKQELRNSHGIKQGPIDKQSAKNIINEFNKYCLNIDYHESSFVNEHDFRRMSDTAKKELTKKFTDAGYHVETGCGHKIIIT